LTAQNQISLGALATPRATREGCARRCAVARGRGTSAMPGARVAARLPAPGEQHQLQALRRRVAGRQRWLPRF